MSRSLTAMRVLIVEDEYYLAEDLAEELRAQGAEVVGPVGTFEGAMAAAAEGRLDFAVIDMNLRGEMAFPIADRLRGAGVPFLIATGYNEGSLPERFAGCPCIEKPFDPRDVIPHISAAREQSGAGEALSE